MSEITRVSPDESEKDNLIFIGYMGAGKTSVGEACAHMAGAPLLDTDELIEQETGKTITRIFDEDGEETFRDLETEMIKKLISSCDHSVISVGGGLPLRQENRDLLKRLGTVIFLRVRRDTVLERLEGDTTRPNLMGDDRAGRVDSMLAARNPVYLECSHWAIDTDEYTPEELARAAMETAGWPRNMPL